MNRKIIHLDMDAFFAAIEERDDPSLRGKPVIVGSPPDSRGVVSTCNYEARKYGVHSAMSSREAYRRCPHAVFEPGHFENYSVASHRVHEIMRRYTDCIEFLSLDEGYMDVTGSERFFGSAEDIAKSIQEQVFEAVKTTCSVGVGYNMLSAKLASEEKKPNGLFVIPNETAFYELMKDRPVGVLYGIGKKTEEKLNRMRIRTVADLANTPPERLRSFGIIGEEMLLAAHGIDRRAVTPNAPAKSVGKEVTFPKDTEDTDYLSDVLLLLCRKVSDLLKAQHFLCRTVTLKIKFCDMQSITRSHTGILNNSADALFSAARELLLKNPPDRPVRLIGVSAGNLTESGYEQISFADMETHAPEKEKALDAVITGLRSTFGKDSVQTAKEMLIQKQFRDIGEE